MKFSKKFVCEDARYSTYEKNVQAPLFRKSFNLNVETDYAEVLVCGLGFYDIFVNGVKITKGYIAPYVSNPDHYIYFDKYDIRPYLNNGENVIGIMLGDGHLVGKTSVWNFKDNVTNSAPMLAITAEIKCGESIIEFEADEFVCCKGPVIFNDYRSGVFYDARLEKSGWCEPGFDACDWHKPISCVRPRGKVKICEAEPIRVSQEIKPISIKKGALEPYKCDGQVDEFINSINPIETAVPYEGGYIYDFGENNSGIYRLKIKGERGQKIDIQCGEQLIDGKLTYNNINFYPDGFSQRDIYYLKGEGEEIFEPMFTFHGYRYIYIYGVTPKQATEDLLTYLVMSSDLEERGTFECSDEIANTIYQMGRRSDISNFYYFPLDCPHREKNGWTGDASMSAEHMMMTIGAENSYREWLNNIRAAQTEDGKFPGIVPTYDWGYVWGNGPAWDSVIVNLPYFVYKYRGEVDIISENATAMLRYFEYMSKIKDNRGLVEYGLGDWAPVGKTLASQCDTIRGFTDSIMVFDMCNKAAEMFEKVNLPLHKSFVDVLGKDIRTAIRKEYVDSETLVVKNECQSSQAMALFYGIFDKNEEKKAFEVLMKIIQNDNFSFTCGFLGMRVLFHTLARFGEEELAYKMITKTEFPSYGYWVSKGETTFLEQFNEYDGYFRNSKNHHFFGDVINWFMSCVGGLNVQHSNFVKISPHFIEKLNWCKVSHKLPNGEIEIYWNRNQNGIELSINRADGIEYILDINGYDVEEIHDGKYFLRSV